MKTKALIQKWFQLWEKGDFQRLPITPDFKHTSPFGIIDGKNNYLELVENNRDKFLGYTFTIIDALYEDKKACVRYKGKQNDFELDVSEWYYLEGDLIKSVVAYYHIGEVRADRQLNT